MKTRRSPHDATLRYWMVRVPDDLGVEERKKAYGAIRMAGFDITRAQGFRAQIAAISLAKRIEKATGIEMEISKHDFL